MKRTLFALLAVLALLVSACVTGRGSPNSVVTELTETIHEACDFYETAKPQVLEYRQWAKENWDKTLTTEDGHVVPVIPEKQKELLAELDNYLPRLDGIGSDICYASDLIRSAKDPPRQFDWDRVLSVTMKVASTAVQLKADGAF